MPKLQTASHKADSIQIGANTGSLLGGDAELDDTIRGGKWEDEEERRFFEDIIDLKDYVPKGVLGIDDDGKDGSQSSESKEEKEQKEKERVEEEVRKLEEELEHLEVSQKSNGNPSSEEDSNREDEEGSVNDEDGSVYDWQSCLVSTVDHLLQGRNSNSWLAQDFPSRDSAIGTPRSFTTSHGAFGSTPGRNEPRPD